MVIDRVKPQYLVKHVPVLLYPSQMPHGQTWDQTWASTLRTQ